MGVLFARRQGTVDKQGSPRVSLRRRGRAESAQCFAAAMGSGANSLTRGALHIFVQSTLSACRAQRMVFLAQQPRRLGRLERQLFGLLPPSAAWSDGRALSCTAGHMPCKLFRDVVV